MSEATNCTDSEYDFSDLKALFFNCTLKKSPRPSHTEGLLGVARKIMEAQGVDVEIIRTVDHPIAAGVQPDMTDEGWDEDAWPELWEKVLAADIVVIGTPIWLGEKSSECNRLIERLYSQSAQTNDDGQFIFYGKTGGCVITGNEDGVKHCSMSILYALTHLGFVVPPQADAGWIGEVGPGKSYCDEGSGGPENEFTQRNTTFMSWNLMHTARMLKDRGGFPAHGNQQTLWDEGCNFDHPEPGRFRGKGSESRGET